LATLIVPPLDEAPWPTLGPQVCSLIEERAVFGPGPLQGQPARLSVEKRAIIYRAYEVFPKGHVFAGRRRFKRVGWSVRKGLAKTEVLAWVAFAEVHPEAPVRCDGFDAYGSPVGRPVSAPYIPLLSYNKDQVEELAYGTLMYVVENSPDADMFDISKERVARIGPSGREDGKVVPLAGSPNARDGARTTFQGFDEPHRLYLPRLHDAHNTMSANLPKLPSADAWSFYVGTAGEKGQGSIQEDLHTEAEAIARGEVSDPRIFYFHRDAGRVHRGEKDASGHDLATKDGLVAAIAEATGPEGEYGPGQFDDIAEQWFRPRADKSYLERVWLNLWLQSGRQAFDPVAVAALVSGSDPIPKGARVGVGFDGALFRDSTGFVVTDIDTGRQQVFAAWEKPLDAGDEWEVDVSEVDSVVDQLMSTYKVFRLNGDPPHYVEQLAKWAGKYPGIVEEYWTNRKRVMAYACRSYRDAISTGAVSFVDDSRLAIGSQHHDETYVEMLLRHIGSAGRAHLNEHDDEGNRLWVLEKIHQDRKFDLCMAAILSWEARLAAIREKQKPVKRVSRSFGVIR